MGADFDSLRSALEEAHSGLYRFSSRTKVNELFTFYRNNIKQPLSQRAFFRLVYQMLSELRDGHLRMDYAIGSVSGKPELFPFTIWFDGDKMIVLSNDSKIDSSILPGAQILTINHSSVAELRRLILSCLPGDGFIETGKSIKTRRSFGYYYWLLVDSSVSFTIQARNPSGQIIETKITGVRESERSENRQRNSVNRTVLPTLAVFDIPQNEAAVQLLRCDTITVLRMHNFIGERFTEELDSLFDIINRRHSDVLMLDLRGNGGGDDMNGAYTVSLFQKRPFRYYDHIWMKQPVPSFASWKKDIPMDTLMKMLRPAPGGGYFLTSALHPGVAEQLPAPHSFQGKLLVLIDGGTMSTAADVAAILKSTTGAIFIGEETGGTYEGNTSGAVAELTLPKSGFLVKIHLYEYFNAVGVSGKGHGIFPDKAVTIKASDVLDGKDVVMEQALLLGVGGKQ